MNGVDQIWISVLGEWISNKLTIFDESLATSCESALWFGESLKNVKIVGLEVDSQQELRLKVSWRFSNIGTSESWLIIVVDLNLVLSELITPNKSINVNWINTNT
jgi:hypothetical protein